MVCLYQNLCMTHRHLLTWICTYAHSFIYLLVTRCSSQFNIKNIAKNQFFLYCWLYKSVELNWTPEDWKTNKTTPQTLWLSWFTLFIKSLLKDKDDGFNIFFFVSYCEFVNSSILDELHISVLFVPWLIDGTLCWYLVIYI